MAIVSPVALTLGYKLGDLPLLTITSGATFSGCVFGDHCSPVSVSTIMASIFSGSELMVYTLTQLIYAFIYAAIAGVIYIVYYNREWVHTSNLSIGNTIFCNAVFRKLLPE
jgi:Na+/H+ antiporter NhaC